MESSGIVFLSAIGLPFLLAVCYFAWQLIKKWRDILDILINAMCVVGLIYWLCFLALMMSVLALGGSPQDSRIEGGRYFVGMHHVYHEVSKNTFFRLQFAWDWFDRSERWALLFLLWLGLLLAISYVTRDHRRNDATPDRAPEMKNCQSPTTGHMRGNSAKL